MVYALVIVKKDDNILIRTSYEEKDKVQKHIKGAVWDGVLRAWKVPATISTYRNIAKADPEVMNPITLTPTIRRWSANTKAIAKRLTELQRGVGEIPTFPQNFVIPIVPFLHQKQATAFCMNLPKAALWLDLGLGKTFTSILVARLRFFYKQICKVLIVCPRSIMTQWVEEINRFSPKGEQQTFLLRGTPAQKAKAVLAFQQVPKNKLAYAIVTYESLDGLRDQLYRSAHMFILDESTKIKNPKAIRTKNTIELCNTIPYGLALTGLAYLTNPIDLFSQIQAIDRTVYGTNSWEFGNHYIDFFKASFGRGIRGYKHIDELKSRAYYVAFSRTKADCLDLPEKMYSIRRLPLYDTQKKFYDQITEDILGEVDVGNGEILDVKGTLAKLERIQQVLAGFIYKPNGEILWLDSPKYNEMVDIVSDSPEKFIIWARHTETLHRAQDALYKKHIRAEIFNKELKPDLKDHFKDEFKNGNLDVIICQLQSESKGLNLTAKKPVNTIYLETGLSGDDRWQSEARTHRIGMTGTAAYIDLLIEDTVDEGILSMIKNNLKISEYISMYGMEMLLGKGGSVQKYGTGKIGRGKRIDKEEDDVFIDTGDLEGFD